MRVVKVQWTEIGEVYCDSRCGMAPWMSAEQLNHNLLILASLVMKFSNEPPSSSGLEHNTTTRGCHEEISFPLRMINRRIEIKLTMRFPHVTRFLTLFQNVSVNLIKKEKNGNLRTQLNCFARSLLLWVSNKFNQQRFYAFVDKKVQ